MSAAHRHLQPGAPRWQIAAALGVAAILMAACSSSAGASARPAASAPASAISGGVPASSGSAQSATISFMEAMSSGTLKTTLDTLVGQFEAAYPGIKVTLVAEPNYGTLRQKEEAAIAAGNPPTIGQAYEDWAATYAASNAIVPLTSFISGPDGVSASEQSDFWAGVWQDLSLPDGKVWMWPFNKSDYIMYYNANMLTADKLSVPTTWSAFATDAGSATQNGDWGLSMDPGTSSAPANGTYLFVSMMRAYGGHLLLNGKPDLNTPAAVQALTLLDNMEKAGALKVGTNYPGQTALGAGKSLFDMSTVASYYYNQQAIGGKFTMGTAAFPSGPAGQGNAMQGTNIVLFAKSTPAQQQAAWTFMHWLTGTQQTATWASGSGYLPVTKSGLQAMSSYVATHPYVTIAAQSLASARGVPPQPWFTQEEGAIATALESVLINNEGVQAALAAAQATSVAAAASGS